MREGMGDIVGRRIVGAFLRLRRNEPHCLLLLTFEDGSSYGFYSDTPIYSTAGLWPSGQEHAAGYLRDSQIFCCEAVFDKSRNEVVERRYAGLVDTKSDRVRRLKPPAYWSPAVSDERRFREFLRLCFQDGER